MAFKNLSIKTKLLVPVLAITCLFGVIGVYLIQTQMEQMLDYQETSLAQVTETTVNQNLEAHARNFDLNIHRMTYKALEEAALFSQVPVVQKAYEIALSGQIDDPNSPQSQQARQQLRKDLNPFIDGYLKQTKRKMLKLHFHLPNGRSLVRLWRKDWQTKVDGKKVDISDDISSFRKSVIDSNQTGQPIRGIEVGRGGFALRGISPVVDAKGKQLGTAEVLFPIENMLKFMRTDDALQFAVYMKKQLLPIATKLRDPKVNPIVFDQFVYCASTDKTVTDSLTTLSLLEAGLGKPTIVKTGNHHMIAFPIRDYAGKSIGVMVGTMDITQQLAQMQVISEQGADNLTSLNTRILMGSGLTLIVWGVFIAFLVHLIVIKPVKRVAATMQSIADGDGDLTKRVTITAMDEVGVMASWFNQVVENLQNIIMSVNGAIKDIATASAEIVKTNQSIATGMTEQSRQSTQVASAIEQMSSTIIEVARQGADAVNNAETSKRQAAEGEAVVGQAVENIRDIAGMVNHSASEVGELGKHTEQIGQVINVINEIADQTNLLALNAAIEAARAGEHGRGFAVVANEVRKLAERTTQATEEVEQTIQAVQQETQRVVQRIGTGTSSVEEGVKLAEQAGESLGQIVKGSTEVSSMIQAIAAATEEQSATSEQIKNNIELIDTVTKQSADNVKSAVDSAMHLNEKVEQLKKLTGKFQLDHVERRSENTGPPKGQPDRRSIAKNAA